MGERYDLAADELYGLPLDEFVPRRDALARDLRAEGAREDADAIKRLPKPSAPAWAVNQLVRKQADGIARLLAAGDELRRVQEWLLRGEADPRDLRTAVEAERGAVAELVRAAADLLTAAGRAPRGDVLERVGETLHAAAADPDMRTEVQRGRVVRDRAAVGLGGPTAAAPAGATRRAGGGRRRRGGEDPDATTRPDPATGDRAAGDDSDPRGDRAKRDGQERRRRESAAARREAAAEARRAVREAEAEAKAAERMRAAADRAVDRAARALEAAEETWERARDGLNEARDELAAAEKAAQVARAAAADAEAAAEQRRRTADDADDAAGD